MIVDRRSVVSLALAGGMLWAFPWRDSESRAATQSEGHIRFALSNGMRVHCFRTRSSYISAALVLRSQDIMAHAGLAHILEHTSFTGAAGGLTAPELKAKHKATIQDSNASTAPGILQWYASFLPKYTPEALHLLAITSLDQRFDVETVASEARVVREELYLDRYSSGGSIQRRVQSALYGKDHPYGRDTLEAEIAKAKMPARKLAAELQDYAALIRLPANMDLFLVGDVEPTRIRQLAEQHFGRYPSAAGPMLQLPRTASTRTYKAITGRTGDLKRPLSEVRIAWNTGVSIGDPDACVLVGLSEYANDVLFSELREKHGDSYSPEVSFEPDSCSGVFVITATSSSRPDKVERRIFSALDQLKRDVDPVRLVSFRERFELKKAKSTETGDAILDTMVARVVDGCALADLDAGSVSSQDLVAAARRYLPQYRGAYVRLRLRGT